MAKTLTPQEGEKYSKLFGDFRRAVDDSHGVLLQHGVGSNAFAEADARTGRIWLLLREMQGMTRAHWAD